MAKKWAHILCLVFLFTGCAFYRSGQLVSENRVIESDCDYLLGIVEFDDQGWFVDRGLVEKVLSRVSAEVEKGGATIVVYTHGWHHDGSKGDSELADFRKTLAALVRQNTENKTLSRSLGLGPTSSRVVGVYVAWRGKSLPWKLDYATFWDRRPAALRVGHGDAPELFSRLDAIYRASNLESEAWTYMVSIGNSFGGQVTFAAVADTLKQRLADQVGVEPNAKQPKGTLRGYGDLVVLVNPALDAAQYESIDILARKREYSPSQRPVLMVVSSEGDWPNRLFFPPARFLSVRKEPLGRSGQFRKKTRTLGHVRQHVTHCLSVEEESCRGYPESDKSARSQLSTLLVSPKVAETAPLSGSFDTCGTTFRPVQKVSPYLPFTVIRATDDVVSHHTDSFNEKFRCFLLNYVQADQLKRLALR
ncbi:MAG TPA: hypothetical protein VMO47_12650 [Rhodothermales bacterium]|nr:hypothetical protein [Rhodothermales bacterium]